GLVVEVRAEKSVQRARAGRELAQEEVLGRDPPRRRVPADRALERSGRAAKPRPDHRSLRMLVREGDELLERAVCQPRVRVQEQEVASGADAHARVVSCAEAAVLLLEQT